MNEMIKNRLLSAITWHTGCELYPFLHLSALRFDRLLIYIWLLVHSFLASMIYSPLQSLPTCCNYTKLKFNFKFKCQMLPASRDIIQALYHHKNKSQTVQIAYTKLYLSANSCLTISVTLSLSLLNLSLI